MDLKGTQHVSKEHFSETALTLGWTPVWNTKQITGLVYCFILQNHPVQSGKQMPYIKYKEQNSRGEARIFHKRPAGRKKEADLNT